MSSQTFYRVLNYLPNLGNEVPVPLAILVERGSDADLRFRGESKIAPGEVNWSYFDRDLSRVGVTGVLPWVLDAWQEWLTLTLEDFSEQREKGFSKIGNSCPDFAMTAPQEIPDVEGRSLCDIADELADSLLAHPISDRLDFLFGRYLSHPLMETVINGELTSKAGDSLRFDYLVRQTTTLTPPVMPELTIFRLAVSDQGDITTQISEAVLAFEDALQSKLPVRQGHMVVLTDSADLEVLSAHTRGFPVISIFAFNAPAQLQNLIWAAKQQLN